MDLKFKKCVLNIIKYDKMLVLEFFEVNVFLGELFVEVVK